MGPSSRCTIASGWHVRVPMSRLRKASRTLLPAAVSLALGCRDSDIARGPARAHSQVDEVELRVSRDGGDACPPGVRSWSQLVDACGRRAGVKSARLTVEAQVGSRSVLTGLRVLPRSRSPSTDELEQCLLAGAKGTCLPGANQGERARIAVVVTDHAVIP